MAVATVRFYLSFSGHQDRAYGLAGLSVLFYFLKESRDYVPCFYV